MHNLSAKNIQKKLKLVECESERMPNTTISTVQIYNRSRFLYFRSEGNYQNFWC